MAEETATITEEEFNKSLFGLEGDIASIGITSALIQNMAAEQGISPEEIGDPLMAGVGVAMSQIQGVVAPGIEMETPEQFAQAIGEYTASEGFRKMDALLHRRFDDPVLELNALNQRIVSNMYDPSKPYDSIVEIVKLGQTIGGADKAQGYAETMQTLESLPDNIKENIVAFTDLLNDGDRFVNNIVVVNSAAQQQYEAAAMQEEYGPDMAVDPEMIGLENANLLREIVAPDSPEITVLGSESFATLRGQIEAYTQSAGYQKVSAVVGQRFDDPVLGWDEAQQAKAAAIWNPANPEFSTEDVISSMGDEELYSAFRKLEGDADGGVAGMMQTLEDPDFVNELGLMMNDPVAYYNGPAAEEVAVDNIAATTAPADVAAITEPDQGQTENQVKAEPTLAEDSELAESFLLELRNNVNPRIAASMADAEQNGGIFGTLGKIIAGSGAMNIAEVGLVDGEFNSDAALQTTLTLLRSGPPFLDPPGADETNPVWLYTPEVGAKILSQWPAFLQNRVSDADRPMFEKVPIEDVVASLDRLHAKGKISTEKAALPTGILAAAGPEVQIFSAVVGFLKEHVPGLFDMLNGLVSKISGGKFSLNQLLPQPAPPLETSQRQEEKLEVDQKPEPDPEQKVEEPSPAVAQTVDLGSTLRQQLGDIAYEMAQELVGLQMSEDDPRYKDAVQEKYNELAEVLESFMDFDKTYQDAVDKTKALDPADPDYEAKLNDIAHDMADKLVRLAPGLSEEEYAAQIADMTPVFVEQLKALNEEQAVALENDTAVIKEASAPVSSIRVAPFDPAFDILPLRDHFGLAVGEGVLFSSPESVLMHETKVSAPTDITLDQAVSQTMASIKGESVATKTETPVLKEAFYGASPGTINGFNPARGNLTELWNNTAFTTISPEPSMQGLINENAQDVGKPAANDVKLEEKPDVQPAILFPRH